MTMCQHPQDDRIYSQENRVWCCGSCGDSSVAFDEQAFREELRLMFETMPEDKLERLARKYRIPDNER